MIIIMMIKLVNIFIITYFFVMTTQVLLLLPAIIYSTNQPPMQYSNAQPKVYSNQHHRCNIRIRNLYTYIRNQYMLIHRHHTWIRSRKCNIWISHHQFIIQIRIHHKYTKGNKGRRVLAYYVLTLACIVYVYIWSKID